LGINAGNDRLVFSGNNNVWGSTAGDIFDGNGPLTNGGFALPKGKWIKTTWHIVFSADPAVGKLEVFGDLGDGLGMRTLVPLKDRATMKYRVDGVTMDPSHLRVGIYRNPLIVPTASLYVDGITVASTRAVAEATAYGVVDTTPPAVPTGLAATAGDAQVSLDWSDNVEGDLAGYRVYRDGAQVFDGVASAYLDSSAANGTTHSYTVSAYDTSGNVSAQSSAVQATPLAAGLLPAVPTGLAATVAPGSVTLGWDANTDPDVAYRLRRDGVEIYAGSTAGFTDSTAPAGEKVSYTVSAYDTAGNESAQSAAVEVLTRNVRRRYAAGGLLSALSLVTPDGPVTLLAPGTRGVSNAEGFAGMATRVITTVRAGRHGSVNRTRHRQDRQISWEGTLQGGGDPDRAWWEYQQIARALASAQDEDRELHYTLGQDLPLFARVRLEELSAPIQVGPNAIKYAATVRAQDPRGYSTIEQIAQTGPLFREDDPVGTAVFPLIFPFTFAQLTTGTLAVYNDGTVGTPPIIELDGYLLNPVVQLADRRLVFAGEIAEGDTLTIDTDKRTVVLNGTANRRGLLDSVQSRWFELPPYPAVIELLPEAFAGAGGLRVRFRDAIQ
jgi:fibronectin type 3 domain-containing protein